MRSLMSTSALALAALMAVGMPSERAVMPSGQLRPATRREIERDKPRRPRPEQPEEEVQERLSAAEAKRERRRQRNLQLAAKS